MISMAGTPALSRARIGPAAATTPHVARIVESTLSAVTPPPVVTHPLTAGQGFESPQLHQPVCAKPPFPRGCDFSRTSRDLAGALLGFGLCEACFLGVGAPICPQSLLAEIRCLKMQCSRRRRISLDPEACVLLGEAGGQA